MADSFEAKEIYCTECDSDYALAWSDENEKMYVVCECGEAESVEDFADRFRDEYVTETDDRPRGYQ